MICNRHFEAVNTNLQHNGGAALHTTLALSMFSLCNHIEVIGITKTRERPDSETSCQPCEPAMWTVRILRSDQPKICILKCGTGGKFSADGVAFFFQTLNASNDGVNMYVVRYYTGY
jgi:hypothetical protein